MLNDRTTSAHIHERIKEIFSETITHEREIIFKKLGTQITNLKFENEQLQREIERLKNSN
jgi:predicted RNase H-like nuclease (RuvC/YqgF family)